MNISKAFHQTPADVADWSDVAALQQRMAAAVEKLAALAPDVGAARQIIEFNGDQRKRCLAIAALPLLKAGASAAAADLEARASDQYGAALKQLAKELVAAETVRAEYEVERLKWETARSLLSFQKESTRHL